MTRTNWPTSTLFGRHMEQRFPNWQALRGIPTGATSTSPDGTLTFNEIRLVGGAPLLVPEARGSSLVGDTIHVLLQLRYTGIDWKRDGSRFGRDDLRRITGQTGPDPVWRTIRQRVDSLLPFLQHPQMEQLDTEEAVRLAAVIGLHNAVNIRKLPVGLLAENPRADLDELLAVASDEQVEATAKMLHLAADRLPDPHQVGHAYSSVSTYAGRADLLLDGTLLEVKSIAPRGRAPMINHEYAYQLLWYLLTLDPRVVGTVGGVREVGWYYARHGLLWVRSADEFLSVMAGRTVVLAEAIAEADTLHG
ncbi:MAG: hypothetical protein ACTHYR_16875 [Brachybacterium sp.]